jgi:hypothetical protein
MFDIKVYADLTALVKGIFFGYIQKKVSSPRALFLSYWK